MCYGMFMHIYIVGTVVTGMLDPYLKLGLHKKRYNWDENISRDVINSINYEPMHIPGQVPPAILIGVSKAGTGALLSNIEMHPLVDIRRHSTDPGHCYFVNSSEKQDDWYRQHLRASAPFKVTIDQCLGYLDG